MKRPPPGRFGILLTDRRRNVVVLAGADGWTTERPAKALRFATEQAAAKWLGENPANCVFLATVTDLEDRKVVPR